jgi:hypothetical protein
VNDVYINKKLERFGILDGNQIFRLARTDQLEYRRVGPSVILTKKYNYLNATYWVIEKLMPVSGPNAELLPGRNVSYEPIFVFKKPDDRPIIVSEDVVLSFVHLQLFGERKKRDLVKEELDEYERAVDKVHQFLQSECSPMSMQLHVGEAIVNPGIPNGRRDVSVPSPEGNSGIETGPVGTARSDSSGSDE